MPRSRLPSLALAGLWLACAEPVSPPNQPAGLRIIEGDNQVRFPDSRLLDDLSVEVVDTEGQRIADADLRVEWELLNGDGVLQPNVSFTNGGGIASTTWVLGSGLGTQRVRATVEGLDPVQLSARVVPIGPIVFASTRDVAFNPPTLNDDIAADLFVTEPDGSEEVRLTKHNGAVNWVNQPAWSPSGVEVVFVRALLVNPTNPVSQTLTPNGIHLLHLLNGQERRTPPITNNGFFLSMTDPAWSPGGGDLATVNGQIWLLAAGGSNVRSATDDPNRGPTWSPDGSRIAFGCATGICTQVARQNTTRLPISSHSHDHAPDWSADGTKIAFARTGANRGIWVIDPDGQTEQQIVFGEYTTPSWSPDGQELVAVLTNPGGLRDIVRINVASGQVTNLTDGAGDNWDPAWRR